MMTNSSSSPHVYRLPSTVYLYLTAFIGGLVSLALELAASRLLAPAFGTTELVWSAIIGLILLYLSVGYALGGRWADRSPHPATLYTILTAAGLTIATIPLLARPMLRLAARGMMAWSLPQIAGPFIFVLVLFVAPVTLLACVSPFVIRLSVTDMTATGGTAGKIYAVSTLGSFIGTFLPNLVLIPNLGTYRTFVLLAMIAAVTGLWGLWHASRRRFWQLAWTLLLLSALFILKPGAIKPQAGLIHEEESIYNFIQVVENTDGSRYLLLNEGQGIHSVYLPGKQILTGGPWDYYLIAPYFNAAPHPPDAVGSLLVIGLAAGTTPRQYTAVYGAIPIDGVEIDPAIIRVGRDYFAMTQPNLTAYATDGRTFLTQTTRRYDVVAVDAYRLPYIPWHLTTVEFFAEVRAHLTEKGVVAINVGHTPDAGDGDWRLVEALVATMQQVYPSVYVIEVPDSFNAIVVATVQPTTASNLVDNLPLLTDARLRTVAEWAMANLRTVAPGTMAFTDDRAPVEQLTHSLALRYLLGAQ
ncbi:MAG TPA: fused MFS/spermidine synthase [Anaerolineae bacterium]|nr:fused MFS/spermidine synthase [Anaerolineae bacterium]HQK15578.1 fused MFS/spermidine synthase [Anaerolineae bacterium]